MPSHGCQFEWPDQCSLVGSSRVLNRQLPASRNHPGSNLAHDQCADGGRSTAAGGGSSPLACGPSRPFVAGDRPDRARTNRVRGAGVRRGRVPVRVHCPPSATQRMCFQSAQRHRLAAACSFDSSGRSLARHPAQRGTSMNPAAAGCPTQLRSSQRQAIGIARKPLRHEPGSRPC